MSRDISSCIRFDFSQVNCLTEIFFEEALSTAAAIHQAYASSSKPAEPLHACLSLKDCFNVRGVDTTIGFVACANDARTEQDESEMAKLMRAAGAILFCKTVSGECRFGSRLLTFDYIPQNVATAMMIAESYNNVWGYTTNPLNRNLSSGVSSGGESALLAMKGAPIGVGSVVSPALQNLETD